MTFKLRPLRLRGFLLAGVLTAIGCQGAEDSRLEESRGAWQQLISTQGETYSYAVPTSSFTGYSTLTGFQVENGAVTYRRFESSEPGADGGPTPPALIWEERGVDVGSHPGGAPAARLDDLYRRCATEVLTRDPDTNFITLMFDDRNFLQVCTYFPRNCADDCAMGVWISDLKLGKKY